MKHYFVSRGNDGLFYIVSSRESYIEGGGYFQAVGYQTFGPFDTRQEAEHAMDTAEVSCFNLKIDKLIH